MPWKYLGSVHFWVLPLSAYSGQSSRTASTSPSIESLSGGRGQSTSSPPPHSSRGSDVSASSPPPSANKKESFFNITRSRSHSKSMGRKETVSHPPFSFSNFPSTVLYSFPPHLHLHCECSILSHSLLLLPCARVQSAGGRPGSAGVLPAGPDQRPGGHEQILCQDDEHSHLWARAVKSSLLTMFRNGAGRPEVDVNTGEDFDPLH